MGQAAEGKKKGEETGGYWVGVELGLGGGYFGAGEAMDEELGVFCGEDV